MATTRVGDIRIYYEVHGSGEPLLLIMGLGGNAADWQMQIPYFSREYQVIAFDNRGAGRSDKPKQPYTIAQMADDAAALLKVLGIASAHVYGVSMGGMIAQEMALRHPARVRSLILGGTMAGGPSAVMAGPQMLQRWASTAALPLEESIVAGLSFLYSDEFIARNRRQLVDRALEMADLAPPIDALQRQFSAVARFNACDRLDQIRVPTLIIAGTCDKIVPVENSRILAERIPGAELVELEGAGHGFLAERAEEANAAVGDFLRRHRSAEGAGGGSKSRGGGRSGSVVVE
jgi:3-oxoadipate enol-lactonase